MPLHPSGYTLNPVLTQNNVIPTVSSNIHLNFLAICLTSYSQAHFFFFPFSVFAGLSQDSSAESHKQVRTQPFQSYNSVTRKGTSIQIDVTRRVGSGAFDITRRPHPTHGYITATPK
jgi:hypothetical protein